MNWLRTYSGLAIILTAFLALGVLYLRETPLLETPDEPSHFSVVKYFADEGRLPPLQPALLNAGPVPLVHPGPPVYYAPPLYYVLGALLIADLDTSGFAQGVIPNPNWERGWAPTPGRSPENKHFYAHTADQRPPYTGWAAGMIRLRIFSLLLGGITVLGVYALARTLWHSNASPHSRFRDPHWALVATALVAFNPAFIFVTIGVTNDALLIALSTWSFVVMARLVSREYAASWEWTTLLGVLLGLAALTKQSALAFLPLAALAVLWGARVQTRSRRTALKWLLLSSALVAVLAAWWYLHNGLAYGDPLGFRPHRPPTEDWTPPLSFLLRQLGQALRGYWGSFGWGLILVEPAVHIGIWLFVLLGSLGFLFSLWQRRAKHKAGNAGQGTGGLQPETRVAVILALGLLLNLIGLLLWLWRTSAPYGRLLFPTLGPLAVLAVAGWQRWLGSGRRRFFAWAIVLLLGLFALIVPWRYLRPAYASPVVNDPPSMDILPLDVRFDESVRLFGYRISPTHAEAGGAIELTLDWQAITTLDENLTVFVQIAPTNPEQRIAGLDDFLGSSRYPTKVWRLGETIEQVHRLRVPFDVPAPALYWFNVGIYSGPEGERLPVIVDGTPVPGRVVRIGPVWLQNQDGRQPDQETDFRLGPAIRFSGYDVKTPRAGSVELTLHWQAIAAPEGDWNVFVHLLSPDGSLVTQHDGPVRAGEYPTWAWQPGDRIPDTHILDLPSDFSPGLYSLRLGLYRPEDGTRMPVFDNTGKRVPNDVVVLTGIELSGESE